MIITACMYVFMIMLMTLSVYIVLYRQQNIGQVLFQSVYNLMFDKRKQQK